MLCLSCRSPSVPAVATLCPACGVYLPALLRDVLPPGSSLRGGAYRVEWALGRGGFGVTYRAVHPALGHAVAIKEFFPRELAVRDGAAGTLSVPVARQPAYRRGLDRFLGEGRLLAGLSHPSVVRVHDLFTERDTAYLVMELIRGRSLRDVLDDAGSHGLPPDQAAHVVEPLVQALAALHAAGIYHLDLKPENVLIGEDGRIVLIDFGAARQGLRSGETRAFTLDYAAPELLAGAAVGPASDLFSLGTMLHELLAGTRPPPAIERLVRDSWRPVGLDEPWRALVIAALRIDPAERPPSIEGWWRARDRLQVGVRAAPGAPRIVALTLAPLDKQAAGLPVPSDVPPRIRLGASLLIEIVAVNEGAKAAEAGAVAVVFPGIRRASELADFRVLDDSGTVRVYEAGDTIYGPVAGQSADHLTCERQIIPWWSGQRASLELIVVPERAGELRVDGAAWCRQSDGRRTADDMRRADVADHEADQVSVRRVAVIEEP